MKSLKRFLAFLGRIMISSIFILSAINKIFEWQKTETALINLFCEWQSYVSSSIFLGKLFSTFISWAPEILIIFTLIEIVSALLIFLGIKERIGAFFLIIILMPATILFHPFWFLCGIKRSLEMIIFFKNLAIIGGILILMVFGSKINDNVIISSPIIPKTEEPDED